MRPLALLIALACAGCPSHHRAATDPTKPHVLSELERRRLGAPALLYELLPEGPRTKVISRFDREGTPIGFWFFVRPAVAAFTVHAMRRELDRTAALPDGGTGSARHPVVYEAGTDRRGSWVAVGTTAGNGSGDPVLRDAGVRAVDVDQLSKFLARWHDMTGVSVLLATPTAVELEIDRLPDHPQDFLSDLATFTDSGTGADGTVVPRPASYLLAEIEATNRVALP